MGRVKLLSVTSSTPSLIRFVRTHYSRTLSPGVRSPRLHGSQAIMQPMDDFVSVSSPDTPHLAGQCMRFNDEPANESSVVGNALGLIFDQPPAEHPTSPALPQSTPQGFVSHASPPDTSVSQGYRYQEGGQEGQQSFLATPNSNTGDAQASSSQQDNININPDVTTVGDNQGTGPVAGTNAIAAARSVLQDIRKKKAEGEATSFSILTAIVSVIEQKMSAKQFSDDDIDILDVIGSFHSS